MRVKELFAFINERHLIYERRQQGCKKPWSADPIFLRYRFCNMYRELDTVTQWIRVNWREPYKHEPDVWFAMVVARLLNLPASLSLVEPLPWQPKKFQKTLRAWKEAGNAVFNGAYMIHADAEEGWLKTDYLAERVLTPMWKDREKIRPRYRESLAVFHSRLMEYRDMGSFMAGQVVADTKFTPLLEHSPDWWTWAAPGPGSMRGMARVEFNSLAVRYKGGAWHAALKKLQDKIDPMVAKAKMPRISAQDLQNCLCEFDKYERVRLGEGKPKQLYKGEA